MKPAPRNEEPIVRQVACPNCGSTSVYAISNAFRPFCSERCKQIDLGAWASEQFAMATPWSPDLQDENNPAV